FIDHVESLRARLYTVDDELGVLYRELSAIKNAAAAEDRRYTAQELERRRQIVTQTYAMFQARYPDDLSTPRERGR
ncbi:MAG TPA: hypothetical protein VK034_19925, partial [Enhygromyxa sp.]|nr:hypothetical protein [Enhygromyxa sp.]